MKYEWRKRDKALYLPKKSPQVLTVPKMNYLAITGEGDPNEEEFSQKTAALYAYSYGIKMSWRKGLDLPGFYDYTVFPLEGIWDSKTPVTKNNPLDKKQLVYTLMIRQPDFFTEDMLPLIQPLILNKVPEKFQKQVFFLALEEGLVVQMLHEGCYDDEAESFAQMTDFCRTEGYCRLGVQHKEIYLSDPRRTAPEKLKTALRFPVEKRQ
ncbi:GyrI-like domain-containing protein [Vagococcus elongatus]|uniref:GyrI-like small molecule binding domain-containing protein n=1 Tax=Vagococcus elongatus TaxID=180344 RepID=A0A430B4S2_9ENTE|nr:GyrI-like domain-containing protein [Vagococcus elongatus]RSU15251.1 hypothetical protein CBF29_02655 [Vagococcus elongatus]